VYRAGFTVHVDAGRRSGAAGMGKLTGLEGVVVEMGSLWERVRRAGYEAQARELYKGLVERCVGVDRGLQVEFV
jgi:hypothetical protein